MQGRVDPSYLATLQTKTDNIRNFCILAHVDHGKTTLSDSLVCSNGVISPKLAGKLRFLDSTEEEQRRGITMHSSAIALLFRLEEKGGSGGGGAGAGAKAEGADAAAPATSNPVEEYLINLVDSPGHIDFSSDVSTATRLCDGALIVIDVLEGLCTQTHAVLYKALKERMKPCLVLNKIDRLAVELRLTPLEAFHHLRRIIENANALAFSLLTSELRLLAELDGKDPNIEIDEDSPFVQEWSFSPEKGNVIFASALDCWGFSVTKFANIWAKKLGVNRAVLQKYFFEDYSFNAKTLKISKCDSSDPSSKPMFATMILEPIWQLYEAAVINQDPDKAAKMAARGLNVELPPREINTRDPRSTAQAIFRKWLPLPDALLRMVVRAMPSPKQAQRVRVSNLARIPQQLTRSPQSLTLTESYNTQLLSQMERAYHDIETCNTTKDEAIVTIFISKMTPIRAGDLSSADLNMLRQRRLQQQQAAAAAADSPEKAENISKTPEDVIDSSTEVFMALGRVFSGVLTRHTDLYILGHRHDPLVLDQASLDILSRDSVEEIAAAEALSSIKKLPAGSFGLYICLGPSAYPVDEIHAGNVVGIIGLEAHVFKTGTLSSTWKTLPMKAITFQAKPMVRVALEPESHFDLPKLEKGLRSLYQYDPVVEVALDDSGQYTMTCLGELHLELCLKTLIDKFAKCQVKASEPLVAFRETVLAVEPLTASSASSGFGESQSSLAARLPPPWRDTPSLELASQGRCKLLLTSGNLAITFRCFPLPIATAKLLEDETTAASSFAEFLATRNSAAFSAAAAEGGAGASLGSSSLSPSSVASPSSDSSSSGGTIASAVNAFVSKIQQSIDATIAASSASVDDVLKSTTTSAVADDSSSELSSRILALGPKGIGPNILLFAPDAAINIHSVSVPGEGSQSLKDLNDVDGAAAASSSGSDRSAAPNRRLASLSWHANNVSMKKLWSKIHSAVVAGFQVVAAAGPIMQEPLHGVGYTVESVDFSLPALVSSLSAEDLAGMLTEAGSSLPAHEITAVASSTALPSSMIMMGQVISEVKDTLRLCMLSCPMRVVEPIYECELQCDQSQLGNLYSVLSKRRGEVTKEDIIDGTSLFLLSSTLPVAESFGFAQELLNKTSGNGTAPQLRFSHWNQMEMDPFWRPKTEDELEEFGEQNHHHELNKVRVLVDKMRKRKGLPIEEKIVMFAEKQRTMRK